MLSPDGYRFNNGAYYFPRQPGLEREYSNLGVFTQLYFDRDERNAYIILMNKDYDLQTGRAMGQLVRRIREDFHGVSQ